MRAVAFAALAGIAMPGAALAQGAVQGAGDPGVRAGKPANICRELVAYVHPPAPAAPAAAPAGAPAATPAVQAPQPGQPTPTASPAAGEPQQKSGLSGPVPQSGPGAAGPQGEAQKAAQAAPPAAPAAPAPPKPTPEMIEQVDAAARDGNIAGCRDAARRMRLAGIPLPSPLLALAALDLKYLQAAP
ncbi:hypothetical protein [Methylobacterium nigriterrae]|uniref:hypothetical protein n=1 Tax=Methylobacterium nigriterrae TaxID=3127512 RepID=UPI0030137741